MTKRILSILIGLTLCGCQPAAEPTASPTMRTSSTSSPAPQESSTPTPDQPAPTASSIPGAEATPSQSFGPNFEWVVGRLQYEDLEGGTWTLEFMENPGEGDPYGGKLVLRGGVPEGFQAGDRVRVTGAVAEQQMGINMAGTYYEVESISHTEIER
ncbi:MAG: hypothetical protein KC800_14665 [Candidatus Eremiobacteraeota bacterium]|nr:hypothetical protein [Candidatus Eremiobacteraeota bacterium]